MKIVDTPLPGVLLIEPVLHRDSRGAFFEAYQKERYSQIGLPDQFAQDNVSISAANVLRGMHFQNPLPQGKLVQVLSGSVFDVVVDLRRASATFAQWFGIELSGQNRLQVWVPDGFAHGFCVLQPDTIFSYKCTERFDADSDRSLRWNDPDINIKWPVSEPLVSEKDSKAPALSEIPQALLF